MFYNWWLRSNKQHQALLSLTITPSRQIGFRIQLNKFQLMQPERFCSNPSGNELSVLVPAEGKEQEVAATRMTPTLAKGGPLSWTSNETWLTLDQLLLYWRCRAMWHQPLISRVLEKGIRNSRGTSGTSSNPYREGHTDWQHAKV